MSELQNRLEDRRNIIHHLSQSQLGKTTTLETISGAFLPSPSAYVNLHQRLATRQLLADSDGDSTVRAQAAADKSTRSHEPKSPSSPMAESTASEDHVVTDLHLPRPLQEIEAYKTWSDLQPTFMPNATGSSSTSGVTAGITEYFIPEFYFEDEMAEEEEEIAASLESLQQYKMHGTDFMPADILLPPAGDGTTGNIQSVYISHGHEFQVLAMFQSKRWASDELVKYLRYMSNPRTYQKEDEQLQKRLRETWNLLTGGLSVDNHLNLYKKAIKDKEAYEPPLLPWVAKLLDHEFIFRSRSRGQAPNLLRELMATRMVLKLLLRPSSIKSVEELSKVLQHFQQHYAWATGDGPWSELLTVVQELQPVEKSLDKIDLEKQLKPLDALAYCIKELRVWLPNTWYQLTGITVIDAVGCNDSSALRQAQLWYDEARSDTNMIMLDRDTDASVIAALRGSPFLEKWVTGQLDPAAPQRPVLAIMMYMEKIGVPPPDRQRDIRSPIVTVKYLMKYPDYLARKADSHVSAIREQLSLMIERYLLEKKLVSAAATPAATEAKEKKVQQLANAVPIFGCFPLLGLTLLRNKEQLLADQQYTVEQWTAAVQATRVYDWAAAQLLQPVTAIRSSLAAEIAAELQQQDIIDKDTRDLTSSLELLKLLAKGANISLKHGTKQSVLLNTRFGSGSPFATHFNAAYVQIRSADYKTYFDALADRLSAAFGQQLLQQFMLVFEPFLQHENKDAGSNLEKLFNVLHPSFKWHHRQLPLATIINGAVMRAFQRSIQAIEDLMLAPLRGKMIDALWMLFHQELSEYVRAYGEKQAAALTEADVEKLVELAVSEKLFKEQAAEQFRLAFTPGQHKRRLAVYARSLTRAWDSLLSMKVGSQTIYQNMYDKLTSKYNEVSSASYEVICTELKGVLRQSVSQVLQRLSLKFKENLDAAIMSGYNNFTERVYLKAAYQPNAPKNGKILIIKAIKDATYRLAQLALYKAGKALNVRTSGTSDSSLSGKKQDSESLWVQLQALKTASRNNVKAIIQLLEDPQKVFEHLLKELGDSSLTSDVDPALQLLFCEGYKIAQRHLQLTAAASSSDASDMLRQTLAGASLLEPGTQPQQQEVSVPASAVKSVTGQQMQAMVAALTAHGKELQYVGSNSNDSCLYAVLSAVFGINPSGADSYSQQVVANYRQQTAELLVSEGRKNPDGHWTSALAAQLGFTAPNAAGAAEAVRQHLQQLKAGEALNMVHLAALVQLLSDTLSVQLTVYSPTSSAADDFGTVLAASAAAGTAGMSVSVANVWHAWLKGNPAARQPHAQGILDCWVIVTDRSDDAQCLMESSAAPAEASSAAALLMGLKRGVEDAVGTGTGDAKRQRMGPV